jgi:hypothetical protein
MLLAWLLIQKAIRCLLRHPDQMRIIHPSSINHMKTNSHVLALNTRETTAPTGAWKEDKKQKNH